MSKNQKKEYEQAVDFQKNNQEASGAVNNQNEHYNIRKQALGPNGKR